MKPRLFSVLALLVTFVGGVVTGAWLTDRKQRMDTTECVQRVTIDDVATIIAGLSEFGVAGDESSFSYLPERKVDLYLHDAALVPAVTAYLERRPTITPSISLDSVDGTILFHAGQLIDLGPVRSALDGARV